MELGNGVLVEVLGEKANTRQTKDLEQYIRVWVHGGLARLSSFSGFSPGDEVIVGLAHIALRIRSFSNDDGEGDRDDDGDGDGDDRTSKKQ